MFNTFIEFKIQVIVPGLNMYFCFVPGFNAVRIKIGTLKRMQDKYQILENNILI